MAAYAAGLYKQALLKKRGPLLAAVSGGRTPERLFKKLASLRLPWERAVFFMADERLVPLSSPHSNFGAARKALFSKIPIPPENLHPVRPAAGAAAAYEKELLRAAGPSGGLDLVFLGLGADGHTASIFPGAPAPVPAGRLVGPARAPRSVKPAPRVTLTLKALNGAATLVLLASGPDKKEMFDRAARGDKKIPAGQLRPRGKLYLLFSEKI
jgi:6-phosphogluconolactonase